MKAEMKAAPAEEVRQVDGVTLPTSSEGTHRGTSGAQGGKDCHLSHGLLSLSEADPRVLVGAG